MFKHMSFAYWRPRKVETLEFDDDLRHQMPKADAESAGRCRIFRDKSAFCLDILQGAEISSFGRGQSCEMCVFYHSQTHTDIRVLKPDLFLARTATP